MDGKYIKSAFKIFLIIVVIGFIIQAISFGIYYYNRRSFSEKDDIKSRKEYCEKLIESGEGDLTEYSQCKMFLKWLNVNTEFNN